MSNSTELSAGSPAQSKPQSWMLAVLVAGAFIGVGLIFADSLPLLLAAFCVGLGGLAVLRWPDLATLAVFGLIYTNLPVVAVQVHGAPGVLPALVLAMLGWPLVYRMVVLQEEICLTAGLPYMLGYLAVQVAGTVFSRDPGIAGSHLFSFLLEGAALYLIVTNVVRTKRMLYCTLWVLALGGIIMGGAPLIKQAIGNPEATLGGLAQADSEFAAGEEAVEGVIRQTRAAGTIGEQNRYAQFMLMLVPLGMALVTLEQTRWWKLLAIIATLMALLGAAMAFSRGAAVGCVMAMGIAAWLGLVDRKQMRLVVIAGALALVVLPQYLTRLASLGSIASATISGDTGNHDDGAVRGRVTEMVAALMVFRDHTLVGVGPGMFVDYSHEYGQIIGLRSLDRREAHSLPLGIAAENGLLGLLSFGGLLAVVGLRLLRAREFAISQQDRLGEQIATALLLCGLIYLMTGLFLHMAYIRYFWMLVGIADIAGQVIRHGDRGADLLPAFGQQADAPNATDESSPTGEVQPAAGVV